MSAQTERPYMFDGMKRRGAERLGADAEVSTSVAVEPRTGGLVDRARAFLAAGPAPAVPLIEHVCRLPGAPLAVAEQLALALFSSSPDVCRGADGRWTLVRERLVRPDALALRSLESLTFVVVDVETTGSSPWAGDRITEFGAVTVAGGRIVDRWETLVNPERPIPPSVTRLTRITWDMVRRAPTIRDVAGRIADALRGGVFVAHNAAFDWRFVTTELADLCGQVVRGERLCTVKLARAVVPQLRRRSLDALADYYGIENHARHRAGGDALATAKVLLRLLDAARERGCLTLGDLRQLTRRVPSGGRGRRRRRGLPGFADGEMTA